MEEAIKNGRLMEYLYYPRLVFLNDIEMDRYQKLTRKLLFFYQKENHSLIDHPEVKKLLMDRKRIIHKAADKSRVFMDIIDEVYRNDKLKFCFVYTPEGKDYRISDDERILETLKSMVNDKYPEVKRSLFSILPVSSLLGLSSSTITDRDFDVIKRFSKIESSILYEMLSSPDLLIDEDYKADVSTTERLVLYHKFGLYGIYVLVNALWSNPNCTLSDAKNILKDKSGFDRLLKTIISHFGDRAALIKSHIIY